MKDLANEKCVPCKGGIPPLSEERENFYINQVEGWDLIVEGIHRIQKAFYFEDFSESMKFVNHVAKIAEQEDHHPNIHIYYNKVELEIYTHALNGLHANDFILAAKIDKIQ